MFSSKYLLLGSALIGHVLSAALPWDDMFGEFTDHQLESRADDIDDTWVPDGAPARHPGQTLGQYMDVVLDGDGPPANPATPKQKRDYMQKGHNSTTVWTEDDITYEVTLIEGPCKGGVKWSTVVGPVDTLDGEYIENGTVGDLAQQMFAIRNRNPDKDAREVAFANYKNKAAVKLWGELIQLLDHGWICESLDPITNKPIVLHDELRRKLLEMNKLQYYTFIILASGAGGFAVAGIQAAITHAYAEVELGAEAYFNSAVGIALSIFLATEFSRFAPRVAGAESWSPVVLYAWGRRMVTKSGQALKRAKSSTSQIAMGGLTTAANAANGGGGAATNNAVANNQASSSSSGALANCLTPDQGRAAADSLMERGLPQASMQLAGSALSLGMATQGDTANIGAGSGGVGACHD